MYHERKAPSPGGGGGGGYFHMYACWVCAARETPIFSPKFPLRSIPFSQMTKISAPEHHHLIFFCRSGDHHFQHFFTFQPFIAAHGRLTAASPWVSGRPQCQPDASYIQSVPETPTFTLELAPEPHIFTLELAPEPPFFTLPWHIPTKTLGECPPRGRQVPLFYTFGIQSPLKGTAWKL